MPDRPIVDAQKLTALGIILGLSACGTLNSLQGAVSPGIRPERTSTGSIAYPLQSSSILQALSPETGRDVLFRLKPGQAVEEVRALVSAQSVKALSPATGLFRLRLAPGQSLISSLEILEQSGKVDYAETNPSFSLPSSSQGFSLAQAGFLPDDRDYGLQWNLTNAKIDQAWALAKGNPGITVAVIDSGVDPNHPDLADSLEPLEDIYKEEKGSDLFRNPQTADTLNFDGRDGNGHGTHVTGIIAASLDNGIGIAGVAGGGVRILPIKATDYAGRTDAATLTAAFQRAIDRGADVINISIGGPAAKSTRALTDIVKLALLRGIPVIAATGNDSQRQLGIIEVMSVPAAYDGVIAVGAHTEYGRVASYSNGGLQIDLLAPGGGGTAPGQGRQIWSTWPGYQTSESFVKRTANTYYAYTSGTSMACPHVTGVVALMLAREPRLTPAQIRARLIATADDLGPPGFDEASGYGQLNAYRALSWNTHDAHD